MMVIDKYNLTYHKNICILLRTEFIQVYMDNQLYFKFKRIYTVNHSHMSLYTWYARIYYDYSDQFIAIPVEEYSHLHSDQGLQS